MALHRRRAGCQAAGSVGCEVPAAGSSTLAASQGPKRQQNLDNYR